MKHRQQASDNLLLKYAYIRRLDTTMSQTIIYRVLVVTTVFCSSMAVTQSSYAQEGKLQEGVFNEKFGIEETYNTAESYSIDEAKVHKKKTQKPVVTKKQEPQKDDEQANTGSSGSGSSEAESVLNFNFLHYMIQKFKFADVVDQ